MTVDVLSKKYPKSAGKKLHSLAWTLCRTAVKLFITKGKSVRVNSNEDYNHHKAWCGLFFFLKESLLFHSERFILKVFNMELGFQDQ